MIGRWLCKLGFHKSLLANWGWIGQYDLCAREGCKAIKTPGGWR